ncbi:MAG: tRNA threonylcarbamoyladenosine dehydratase [Clostridia bacterium]|nr:tRNA threonylcarbamoyladenosine dehydratase [Clostridia bacterium]
MGEHFSDRTRLMLGDDGFFRLSRSKVCVFGVGGVGGYAVEALARAGIGEIHLVDSDKVSVSNINRQIIATHSTVGQYKTEVARDRILSINPDCRVICYNLFYSEDTAEKIDLSVYDYIIDAIDSVGSKIFLIASAKAKGVPIISSMGAGNKLDPTAFKVADISKTAVCPLAKAVRVGLRKLGINHLKVVYSEEPPALKQRKAEACAAKIQLSQSDKVGTADTSQGEEKSSPTEKRTPPGSLSFVPSTVGLIIAGEVILDLSIR